MSRCAPLVVLLLALGGCSTPQMPELLGWIYPGVPVTPVPGAQPGLAPVASTGPPPSTLFVPVADGDVVWDQLVNSVDTYFEVAREERVRMVGDVITEGRLTTHPQVASTLLEPWRGDSVGAYQRLESTLQSMRRQAVVRVLPEPGGWLVDVAVFQELEDVPRPQFATASSASFRSDNSIVRYTEPVGGQPINAGWIPQGRDPLLEQRILRDLQRKLGVNNTRRIRGGAK